jgi:BASS family bile acid:Na+ symporter
MLPQQANRASGNPSYATGLLVTAALLAPVFTPLAVELSGVAFDVPTHLSVVTIARLVLQTVVAPMAAGMLLRHFAPRLATQVAPPLLWVATGLLVAGLLPILFTALPAMRALIGNGTLFAFAVFVLAGLGAGHLLGGHEPEESTVLALSTASRHPGIALAIAHANGADMQLATAALLLYLLVSLLLMAPYIARRRRRPLRVARPVTGAA